MVYALIVAALAFLALLVLQSKVPLRYNWRNVAVRWRTTAMTALAFTVVIGLLTVMLGFVNGMYRLTLASGQPGNVIVLSARATDEVVSNLMPADVGDLERQQGIVRENDRPLASRETYLVVNQPIPNAPAKGLRRRFLQVRGLDDPVIAGRVHNLELSAGRSLVLRGGGARSLRIGRRPEARPGVRRGGFGRRRGWRIGSRPHAGTASQRRDPERLDVGDTFTLAGRTWLVTGILQSSGSTFNSEVWAKRSLVAGMFGKGTYTSLILRTRDAGEAQRLKEFLSKDYQQASVQAEVETEYYESLSNTNQQFLYAIAFVTVVMSVGGVFGVMNTMFAAIGQRTRDIGVLRMLGYRRRQILISFLLESVLIALIGGALGCALGSLADGLSATSIVASGPGGGKSVVLRLIVDARILSVGLLLSLGMGILGGLLPALSAMRLKPLEALR